MRSFTRLTNVLSKKIADREAALALHFMHYSFCLNHTTLRAMAALSSTASGHLTQHLA